MKKRKIIFGLLAAWLLVCLIPRTVLAEESDKDIDNNEFTVTLETGLDGVAVEGKSMPVTVTVNKTGKDFSGTLRVIIPSTYDKESIAYEKLLVVPSGGEKSVSFLLPDVSTAPYLRIELENEQGKILYSQLVNFTSLTVGRAAVIGILSDDYTGLNYFDGLSLNTSSGAIETKILRLTADNIPENGEGLTTCQYILIDNYNTSQLSNEQRNAIVSWVNQGGILILGTGSKASIVLEGFQDAFGSIASNGISKHVMIITYGVTDGVKDVDVADLTGEGWQDISSSIAIGGDACQKSYGDGMILVLGYDLAMEPLVSNQERTVLAKNILENAGNDAIFDSIINGYGTDFDENYIENAVAGVNRIKLPSALLYSAIFLLYVIMIGPVSYLILKHKDKREKMWLVMPLTAFGFTIIVFISSMFYRIHKPFIDAVSILEYNDGLVHTTAYMAMESPKGKEFGISFAEDWKNAKTWGYDYGIPVDTTDYACAVLEEGNQIRLQLKQDIAFEKHSLLLERDDYQQSKGFELDLEISSNGFEGQVANQTGYDLKNVVICQGSYYVYLGDLKNGEAKTVTLNSMEYISNLYYYDLDEWVPELSDADYFRKEEQRERRDNENLYRIMLDKADSLDFNQGMVFGMIQDYEAPLLKENSSAKIYSAGIALQSFYQMPEDYQNYSFYIRDINDYMVGGDNYSYTDEYPPDFDTFKDLESRYVWEEMDVLYNLSQLDTAHTVLLMDREPGEQDEYGYEICRVEFYNFETSAYEAPVLTDGALQDISPYIDEQGWMHIKYLPEYPDTTEYKAPMISLVGGEVEEEW